MDPQALQFTVYQPNFAPQHVAVTTETITLGRASDCTIPIRDRFLSRHHAEISYASGAWVVRDCGSVNGTLLNGVKLLSPVALKPGDRIGLGDSEVVFHEHEAPSQLIAIDSSSHAKNLAIPMREAVSDQERTNVLASLAVEFIEDRGANDLFDFILDKVMEVMHPSRSALALLGADGKTFENVQMRRRDSADSVDLTISKTLLGEVVETPLGKHFETEKLYPGYKRYGSYDISDLRDLPHDFLASLSDGAIHRRALRSSRSAQSSASRRQKREISRRT